jgi:uncharacterized membrane protein YeiH
MIRLVLDMLGVAVFAVSGALAGGRKHLDLIGVMVLATVTGVGGGTLRDVLLDRTPVFWINEPAYILVCLASAGATAIYITRGHSTRSSRRQALLYADALGLAFFAISGAQVAQAVGHGGLIAIIMGTMTGVAGGAIRDVLAAEIPLVMKQGELYATAAIAGIAAYLALDATGIPRFPAELCGMTVVALLRVASIRWKLRLPVLRKSDDPALVQDLPSGGSDGN